MSNFYALAVHQFVPSTERELAFDAGDKILLFNWDDPEWWYGEVHGKSGYFPSSYVELENEDDDIPPPPPPVDDDVPPPPPGGNAVVAIWDSTSENDMELSFKAGDLMTVLDASNDEWLYVDHVKSKKQGYVPKNFVEASTAAHHSTASRPKKPDSSTLPKNFLDNQLVAIYDFKAQTSDQLSFSAGEFITVIDQSDKDWWVGQIGNQRGPFPRNYVETPSPAAFSLIEKNKSDDAIVTAPPVPLHKTSSFVSSNPNRLTSGATTAPATATTSAPQPKATPAPAPAPVKSTPAPVQPTPTKAPARGTPAPSAQPARPGEKVCAACQGVIDTGSFMDIDNTLYHKTCFVCTLCSVQLKKFFEKGGQLYCQACFSTKVDGEPCGRCNKPLGSSVVRACGKRFHEACFTCFKCKCALGNVVNNRDGQPWCDNCCRQNLPANKPTSKSTTAPGKRGVNMPKQKWVSGMDY